MATVLRPPFFVPRPFDESYWYGPPNRSECISLLTETKEFGQGGQVPTKRWKSYYCYDVAESVWNAAPIKSPIIRYLTFQKMFGAFGQVPATQWFSDFDDNFSGWLFSFIDRNQTLLTPALPSPTKPIRWRYDHDDSSVWSGGPRQRQLIWQPFLYYRLKYNYDDHTAWQFSYINQNQSILTPIRSLRVSRAIVTTMCRRGQRRQIAICSLRRRPMLLSSPSHGSIAKTIQQRGSGVQPTR